MYTFFVNSYTYVYGLSVLQKYLTKVSYKSVFILNLRSSRIFRKIVRTSLTSM